MTWAPGSFAERGANLVGLRFDEQRMIVERAQFFDAGRIRSHFGARLLDIFQVLAASRVRTEDGSDKGERTRHTVGLHLAQRVGEKRMPVAIAPVNRNPRTQAREFALKAGDQRAILIVDRALAAEVIVMLGDFEHAFTRNVAAAQNVLEERDHVVGLFRTAEGEYDNGVVG